MIVWLIFIMCIMLLLWCWYIKFSYIICLVVNMDDTLLCIFEKLWNTLALNASCICIYMMKNTIQLYVSVLFKWMWMEYEGFMQALTKTYDVPVVSMPNKDGVDGLDYVLDETVLPHRYKWMIRWPRKWRIKNIDEKITISTNCCLWCGQEGYNIRTWTSFSKENWNFIFSK